MRDMVEVRQIFNYVYKNYGVDLIHQLNPVSPGRSFSLIGTEVPIILGLFVPGWPADAEPEKFKTFSLGTIILAVTQPLIRACDRQQQKKAAALLLSTPAAVNRLYELEVDKGKIHYLPYGIDTTCFSPAKSQHTQASGELSILYLASLSHRKGIFTLLDAFEKVVDALPSCKLTIAGLGSELKQVQ